MLDEAYKVLDSLSDGRGREEGRGKGGRLCVAPSSYVVVVVVVGS